MRLNAEAPSAVHETELREKLGSLLAGSLRTAWQHRAYSDADVHAIAAQLRQVVPAEYEAKLQIAGFTAHPYRPPEEPELEQSCSMCMYYERNRQYCNLPELALPVRPEWSCVLWRI